MIYLNDLYPFEHQQYDQMVAQINYVTGLASKFLYAYRIYAEVVSQKLINDDPTQQAITDSTTGSVISPVEAVWRDYNRTYYMTMRALAQMTKPYEKQLRTYMRSYDFDTTVEFNDAFTKFCPPAYMYACSDGSGSSDTTWNKYYEELSPSPYFVEGIEEVDGTDGYSYPNKTSKLVESYMVVPVSKNSSDKPTVYAVRDNSQNSERLTARDTIDLTFKTAVFNFGFITAYNDRWGVSADYANLMTTSTSPAGFKILHSGGDLSALLEHENYSNAGQKLLPYLNEIGMTGVGTGATKLITDRILWGEGGSGGYDADYSWIDITKPLERLNLNNNDLKYSEYDVQDFKNRSEVNQEALAIFSTQNPTVNFKFENKGNADVQLIKEIDPYNSSMTETKIGTDETLSCGTSVHIRIKPSEGKYIKSLKLYSNTQSSQNLLEDLLFHDSDNSLSAEDEELNQELMKQQQSEMLIQQTLDADSTDGYLDFYVTVPYRNAKVVLETGDLEDSDILYRVNLNSVQDKCNVYLNNSIGITNFTKAAGSEVVVQCVPVGDNICTGIKITDTLNPDNEVVYANPVEFTDKNSYTDTDPVYSLSANAQAFSFTMPSCSVDVTPIYEKGKKVTLKSNDGGTIQFVNPGTSELVASSITAMSFSQGDTVIVYANENDERHYLKNISVMGTETFAAYDIEPVNETIIIDGESQKKSCYKLTMPKESVNITAEFANFGDSYKVQIINGKHYSAKFADDSIASSTVAAFNPGDIVTITTTLEETEDSDLYEYSIEVKNLFEETNIELIQDGDNYSFVMPASNVNITMLETSDMHTLTFKGNYTFKGYGDIICTDGVAIDESSRNISAGTDVTVTITTAYDGYGPEVRLFTDSDNVGQPILTTVKDGNYVCTFKMPSENASLEINAKEKHKVYILYTYFYHGAFPPDKDFTYDEDIFFETSYAHDYLTGCIAEFAPGEKVTIITDVPNDASNDEAWSPNYNLIMPYNLSERDGRKIPDLYITDKNVITFTMPEYDVCAYLSATDRANVSLSYDAEKGKASISDNASDGITSKYCVLKQAVTFTVEANGDYYTPNIKVSNNGSEVAYNLVSQDGNVYKYSFVVTNYDPYNITVGFDGETPEKVVDTHYISSYDELIEMRNNIRDDYDTYGDDQGF